MRTVPTSAVLALLLLVPATGAADGKSSQRPDVLLILTDDLGYGDLSCYGATDLETPNVDRLAKEGMQFVNFYANAPFCSPTRASLLSGRYPEAVGVPGVIRTDATNSWGYLSADAVLLPAALKPAGCRTAMVGKWHLGLAEPNLPDLRGFGFFHGFLGDMMDDYLTHRRHGINYMRLNGETIDPQGHATDLFTQWACQWLQQYRDGQPFFLYLAYNAPHSPIQPPESILARYKAKHPAVTEKRAKLAALIEHMDAGVGQVLAALEKTGRADNTLVIFTSDNGGFLPAGATNGPLRDGKGTVYEGGIRVPMVARWPGHIKPGSRSDVVALTMDLYPTVLEAAGLPAPKSSDGLSLLPVLVGKSETLPQRDLFWNVRTSAERTLQAIRRGRYKLLRPEPEKPLELYDLESDPNPKETADLAAKQPELYHELEKALNAHVARSAGVAYRPAGGIGPGEISQPPGKKPAGKKQR